MSALAGIDIALWDLKGRRTRLPIHQLLGGMVRNKVAVYAWIGGNRPNDVESAALARKAQGFKAVKMNATEDMGWLDSPAALDAAVERLRVVRSVGMDAAMDFHGRLHKPMAKQLASRLEPLGPLFIEEPLLSEHPEGIKQIAELTTCPVALGERLYSRWDVKRYLQGMCACDWFGGREGKPVPSRLPAVHPLSPNWVCCRPSPASFPRGREAGTADRRLWAQRLRPGRGSNPTTNQSTSKKKKGKKNLSVQTN